MSSSSDRQPELEALLDYLKRSRGFDFTGYKRASLARRITKRMQAVGIEGYAAYRDYLAEHSAEFEQLFDTILISVTAFFRDTETWDYLRDQIIPRIVAEKEPRAGIRVWSAGCATGQEAYTLAILFAEALGADEFRERVKIYATDVDEPALTTARHGTYAAKDVEGLPPELVEKYFERLDRRLTFRKDMRRAVVFGRNDLIQDAPISRIDLLVCRNALMYFDAQTQARILARFYFALNDGGFLFLGRAETLLAHTSMFTSVDSKRRVFQKVARATFPRGVVPAARTGTLGEAQTGGTDLRDAALRAATVAQIVVDQHGMLIFANDRANSVFRLAMTDVGRPLSELDVAHRPVEIRSLIDQASTERRIIVRIGVEWRPPGTAEARWLDVHVVPLYGDAGAFLGTSLTFADVTAQHELQSDLEQSEHELRAAHEELQSTNEELETTNEELQSTVEELETTNEELQSTNEELETMNEELQSTNEELQTMNDELRTRGDELNEVNRFLEQVFTSLRHGVAVIDPALRVLVWNRKAEDLWGLRSDEAEGSHFLNLDIGLPVDQLRQPISEVLANGGGTRELVVPATNRRGKGVQVRVVCAPLVGRDGRDPQGAIVLMEELSAAD